PYIRQLPETLPPWLLADAKLMSRAKAYETIHFPDDAETLAAARRRLGFEEVFSLSLAALMNKAEIAHEHALAIDFDEQLAKDFVKHLPFRLTNPQRRAIWQIYLDMQRTQPMNRLVEGDVGSGKTVVAAMAALMVMHSGRQVVMMAPTELLARQHYQSLTRLLAALGLEEQVGLLIGGLSKRAKTTIRQQIADGTVRFVVGTHALLQDTVDVHNLGLVIVDEQHRFGVDQRTALQAKAGHAVHVLNTTATPIPRSLALTLYGELDISIIDAKPQGRAPIITTIVSPNSRQQLHDDLRQQLADGRQVFVVCALIQDSSAIKSRSAEQVYREMQREFADYRVGLLHGKLRSDEKDAVMQAFVRHEVDILVSTTVIEVGVDVPNASVMVIEGAERFGLAQAHQLRGRVGRGEHQGYCYLVLSDSAPPSKRIRALQTSHDGFRLAELDLEIRGPGAIYGTMQHGALDLRIASLGDTRLIAAARSAAEQFLARQDNLLHYEQLSARVQRLRAVTNLN
ncbi:ATP-dependent DNA helicase RecG, partial [Candidatus Saccharibacteria bacterium]